MHMVFWATWGVILMLVLIRLMGFFHICGTPMGKLPSFRAEAARQFFAETHVKRWFLLVSFVGYGLVFWA